MTELDRVKKQKAAFWGGKAVLPPTVAWRGGTATEYSVVGACVLVATVGLWTLLGGSLNNIFNVLKAEMAGQGVRAGLGTLIGAMLKADDVKGKNGEMIDEGAELGSPTTQTAGASGDTAAAYRDLKKLWTKAVEEGKMTEEEAANLEALAQQAKKLAEIQRKIETAMDQAGDNVESLLSMQIQLDGEFYTVAQLSEMLGWKENTSGLGNLLIPDSNANGSELNKLKELYIQAVFSGAMQDPAIKAAVTKLTDTVAKLSDISEDAEGEVTAEKPEGADEQFEEGIKEGCEKEGVCSGGPTSGDTDQAGNDIGAAGNRVQ